jgi:hypothetical protein
MDQIEVEIKLKKELRKFEKNAKKVERLNKIYKILEDL